MLKKKKLVFALFLFTCLFLTMSFASANNITDIDDSNNNETNVENHQTKSFTDLNKKINDLNQTEIILEDNYVNQKRYDDYKGYYYPSGDLIVVITRGIFINRSVSIDGQGHVIDANNLSEIFYLNANNITLKNIKFNNSNSHNGGVICNASDITFINCTFMNCFSGITASSVINAYAPNLDIINCTFINNTGGLTGGSVIHMNTGRIINSTFIDNYLAMDNGEFAAIYYTDYTLNVVNETISYAINQSISYSTKTNVQNIIHCNGATIINSTFRNTPAYELHYNQPLIRISGNDTDNDTNTVNSSTNNTHREVSNNNDSATDAKCVAQVNRCKKSSSIIVAKNKVFKKKLKTKRYAVFLKSKNGKLLKNTWISLKIKDKLFKAKTNIKGKATFKITKFCKKGNFKAVVKFKGNKKYKSSYKKVNIKIK